MSGPIGRLRIEKSLCRAWEIQFRDFRGLRGLGLNVLSPEFRVTIMKHQDAKEVNKSKEAVVVVCGGTVAGGARKWRWCPRWH